MQIHDSIKNSLYPYLSHSGPKINDPNRIPIGKMENSVPEAISSNLNFSFSPVATAPRVINAIPKSSIPAQAAKKTDLVLYISG